MASELLLSHLIVAYIYLSPAIITFRMREALHLALGEMGERSKRGNSFNYECMCVDFASCIH